MKERAESTGLLAFSAVLGAAGFAALPYFEARQHRAATGIGRSLASVSPLWAAGGLILIVAAALLFSNRGRAAFRSAGMAAAAAVVPFAFAAAGFGARIAAAAGPETGRIGLGAGFWCAAAASYGMVDAFAPAFGDRAEAALRRAGFGAAAAALVLALTGAGDSLSIAKEFALRERTFLAEALRHGAYAFLSVAAALAAGIPLAYAASRSRFWERPVFFIANTAQAIPTLSLLGLLIVPLAAAAQRWPALRALGVRGIGWAPAGIALFLYALLPIVSNAHAGFRMVDPGALDAARGMGMRRGETLRRVELPLALPALVAGTRTALTQNLGNAVLAGLIGGGGLGSLIFLGLAQAAPDLILLGALPVAAAAFAADRLMAAAERAAEALAGRTRS